MRIDPRALLATSAALFPVVLAASVLFPAGLLREVDWHLHLCWLQGFSQGLHEGAWYPRWIDGANEGLGGPIFLYYAPLAYYIGGAFVSAGFSTAFALKAIYLLSLLLCATGLYRWLAPVAGRHAAILLGAAGMATPQLTQFAFLYNMPASALAVGLMPWIGYALERKGRRSTCVLVLSAALAALMLSHTISAFQIMFFLALAGMLGSLFRHTRSRALGLLLPSALLAACLAAVYIVPMATSLGWIHHEQFIAPSAWRIHANLLFSGGESPSGPSTHGSDLFEIPNALALGILLLATAILMRRGTTTASFAWVAYAGFALFAFALMTPLSSALYERVDVLRYMQYGWRWQAVFVLCVLRVVAAALRPAEAHPRPTPNATSHPGSRDLIRTGTNIAMAAGAIAIAGWNVNLLAPMLGLKGADPGMHRVAQDEAERHAARCIWRDPIYRPIAMGQGWNRPLDQLPREPHVLSGRVHVLGSQLTHQRKRYDIVADVESRIVFPVLNFPGWQVTVDDRTTIADGPPGDGRIALDVARGRHRIELLWEPPPSAHAAGILSGIAWVAWSALFLSVIRRSSRTRNGSPRGTT